MIRALALCAAALALGVTATHAGDDDPVHLPRVEARSTDLLAVGVVHGGRMVVHLSALADNAPVRDASVNVTLRGTLHPTTAEADGSYTLNSKDLTLPGNATVQFRIARGSVVEDLKGTLQIGDAEKTGDKGAARQAWWWVLNFGVCIGFLWLLSRRRKTATI